MDVSLDNVFDLPRLPSCRLEIDIHIALRINAGLLIGVGYVNLSVLLTQAGRLQEALDAQEAARATNERLGSEAGLAWCDAEDVSYLWMTGEWTDGLRRADAYLAAASDAAGYQTPGVLLMRADFRLGLGDEAAALDDSNRGIDMARAVGDPQLLRPSLLLRAGQLLAVGRGEEAIALLEELLADEATLGFVLSGEGAGLVFRSAGLQAKLEPMLRRASVSGPWHDAHASL